MKKKKESSVVPKAPVGIPVTGKASKGAMPPVKPPKKTKKGKK